MSQVEITVRGQHRRFAAPERATVHLQVALEGPKESAVNAGVAQALRTVGEQIRPWHDPDQGPVTWWSSDQLRTWSERPWHQDGKQLPLVFHARAGVAVKFSDFTALSRWLTDVLAVPGVAVERIHWALTEQRQRELTHLARGAAVADARHKAQAYADALDLGAVTALALADAGMLVPDASPLAPTSVAFSRAAATSADGDVTFVPEDIEVEAAVDARFVAG